MGNLSKPMMSPVLSCGTGYLVTRVAIDRTDSRMSVPLEVGCSTDAGQCLSQRRGWAGGLDQGVIARVA